MQARRDSNPQPLALETSALPIELRTFAFSDDLVPTVRAALGAGVVPAVAAHNHQGGDELLKHLSLPCLSNGAPTNTDILVGSTVGPCRRACKHGDYESSCLPWSRRDSNPIRALPPDESMVTGRTVRGAIYLCSPLAAPWGRGSPEWATGSRWRPPPCAPRRRTVVDLAGLEPATCCLEGSRSIQLSYGSGRWPPVTSGDHP